MSYFEKVVAALRALLKKRGSKPPVIRVDEKPRFDDRNSIDRFRRESGR